MTGRPSGPRRPTMMPHGHGIVEAAGGQEAGMGVDTTEARLARLAGAYDQISARLGGVEQRLHQLDESWKRDLAAWTTRWTGSSPGCWACL